MATTELFLDRVDEDNLDPGIEMFYRVTREANKGVGVNPRLVTYMGGEEEAWAYFEERFPEIVPYLSLEEPEGDENESKV